MKEEDKYLVIPLKYVDDLTEVEKKQLSGIIDMIKEIRILENKETDPRYIVCKESEPYAEDVWKLILNNKCDLDSQMEEAHHTIDELLIKDKLLQLS